MPTVRDNDFAYVRRMARRAALATLPSLVNLGDKLRADGCTLMWCDYDTSETALTKRKGMPVGWLASDRTKVTGDFSATNGQVDFVGILVQVPTATLRYCLVALPPSDLTKLTALCGTAITLTTDGQVAAGDPIGWGDDDLVVSNHLCGGSPKKQPLRNSWDMGVAVAADSSTTLSSAVLGYKKSELPDRGLVTYWVMDDQNPVRSMITAGDAGNTVANFAVNVTGARSLKARCLTDTTANDEATFTTPDKPFLPATGKRMCIRGKITCTDATGVLGGFLVGLFDLQGTGSIDYIVDTTGVLCAAAAIKGQGFYKIKGDLKLHHFQSDGTTLDTNTAEDLATLTSGTEVEVMQRGTYAASGATIESFVAQTAAGTALTWGGATISAAVQSYAGAYAKAVAGTTDCIVDLRDFEVAVEI